LLGAETRDKSLLQMRDGDSEISMGRIVIFSTGGIANYESTVEVENIAEVGPKLPLVLVRANEPQNPRARSSEK